jgi:hypothetical protein
MSFYNSPNRFFQGISFRLAKVGVVLALLVGLSMSALQIYISYHTRVIQLDEQINHVVNAFRPAAERAVFTLDEELGDEVIAGLMRNDFMLTVALIDELGQVIAESSREPLESDTRAITRFVGDEYDCLLIADEIATGLGRTGKLFACEHADISPDIMCLGKTLTGGYLSFAATLCTERVARTVCSSEAGVFMHGPTYMGNPLACAAAYKNIELLLNSEWEKNIERMQNILTEELSKAKGLKSVNSVRTLGGIGVIEMNERVDLHRAQPIFVEKGIWLRPFGKLVYMMPPYCISDSELSTLCKATIQSLAQLEL